MIPLSWVKIKILFGGKIKSLLGSCSWITESIRDRMRAHVPPLIWGAQGLSVARHAWTANHTRLKIGGVFVISVVWL